MDRARCAAGVILVATVMGCGKPEPPRPAERRAEDTLLIGLIPERNIFKQFERYEPLAGYLSEKAGIQVKLKVLTHYGNVIENFESLKLDGAFFGSFGYSLAHARLGVEVLARPEAPDGTSTYRGVLFVRKDSGIRSVAQMKGKRLALVAKATMAGYLFPLVRLREAGVERPKAHFKEIYFAGSHDGTIRDVLDGKADVGASKNTVFRELAEANPRLANQLAVVAESVDVPENGLALRRTIDAAVKRRLRDALIAMDSDPEGQKVLRQFGARRFIATTDADYEPVLRYCAVSGIDLTRDRFEND